MTVNNTTKMALQAAIAVAIAEWVSWYFVLEWGYWTTVTVMALTTQTWGESIKRSTERVTMTILGGIVGTILYFILPDKGALTLTVLLMFVFFTVYLYQIYYRIAIFALTGFVVFLFAMMAEWNLALLRDRILDTMIGACIVLLTSHFFLPNKTNVKGLFVGYLEEIKASMAMVFTVKSSVHRVVTSQRLATDLQKIRKDALNIRYEVIFLQMNPQTFHALMNKMVICTQQVMSSFEAYRWLAPHLTKADKVGIKEALMMTMHNIDSMVKCLKEEAHEPMYPASKLLALRNQAIVDDPGRFATFESEALGFFNLMYFFTQLNEGLNEAYQLMNV